MILVSWLGDLFEGGDALGIAPAFAFNPQNNNKIFKPNPSS
jgi:hypothetical protein